MNDCVQRLRQNGLQGISIRLHILLRMVLLLIITGAIYTYIVAQDRRQIVLEGVDAKLLTAARAAKRIAGPDYHNPITGNDSVPLHQFDRIVNDNNHFCIDAGLQYVWSVLIIDSQHIYFTTSTSPDHVLENGLHAKFYELHRDPGAFQPALATMQPHFSTFKNEWGWGRMVLIPERDSNGRVYMFGASIGVPQLATLARDSILQSIAIAATMLLCGFLISFFLSRRLSKTVRQAATVAQRIAGGDFDCALSLRGPREITQLSQSLSTMRDSIRHRIQALRESGDALTRSEHQLRLILNAGPTLIAYVDSECRYRWANEAYSQWFGLTAEQIQGRHVREILGEPAWEAARPYAQRALSGEIFTSEEQLPIPRGGLLWVQSTYTPDRGESGEIQGFVVHSTDIHERKQMEDWLWQLNEELEQKAASRSKGLTTTIDRLRDEVGRRLQAESMLNKRSQILEAFFQHTITPLAFLDRAFNFVRVNEAYAAAFAGVDGKTLEGFAGKNYFALYPDRKNQAIFEQVVQTKQPYRAYAKPLSHPDSKRGVTFWNWWLAPLLDNAGDVHYLVLNLEDVTDRQRAFFELQHRAGQLQKLTLELSRTEDRERKRLAEILHDDLQQQLAAAKFHLGLLNSRSGTDAVVQKTVAHVDEMLKDAIDKSRSLSHELSPAVLNHSDLAGILCWLAKQMQAKHGLMVHVDAAGPIDSPSYALRTFLYKTAQEMLFNVVKHARVKRATIRLRRVGPYICLTVADKGRGFDPPDLRGTAGVGLLSIRERVELLGGRMKIKSAEGKGSTFHVVLPDGQQPPGRHGLAFGPQEAVAPNPQLPHDGHRLRVLLADDHKIVREGLLSLLGEESGIEVVGEAANGREAVDLAARFQPDVVIMDVAMPLINGDEATRQIKMHLPGTRVVALSMHDEAETVEKMFRAGSDSYVLKTAPFDELLSAIRG